MGFISDIADRIRATWARDKEQVVIQVAKGATSSGMPMAGHDSIQSFGYEAVSDYLKLEHDLLSRYVDYEEIDDYPETSAAYDIFADDATQLDGHRRKKVWVTSPDKEIEDNLNYMLHKTIRIDEEIWEMTRTLCKYGNDFEELLVTNEGVRGINFLPPPSVRRVEGPRGELYGFIQDPRGRFNYSVGDFQQLLNVRLGKTPATEKPTSVAATNPTDKPSERAIAFEGWEVVHFRLRSKFRRSIYGHCQRKTSKVMTTAGVKEIQHLVSGDFVQTFDGFGLKTSKIVDVVCSGQKNVFSVKTRHRENFSTSEHPILVFEKNKGFFYKKTSELTRGDLLVVPKPIDFEGKPKLIKDPNKFSRIRLTPEGVKAVAAVRGSERYFYQKHGLNGIGVSGVSEFLSGAVGVDQQAFDKIVDKLPCLSEKNATIRYGKNRARPVNCPEYVDADFAWLFGLFIGDGWTAGSGNSASIALSLDEELNARIFAALARYGLTPRSWYETLVDPATSQEYKVLRRYVVDSTDFVDVLYGLDFIPGVRNKRVPQWVYEAPRDVREAFVMGFLAADGWDVHQYGLDRMRFEICNYNLARDMKSVIDGLGWTCGNVCIRKERKQKFSSHPAMHGRLVNSKEGYILHLGKDPLFTGPYRLEKIISITEQPTAEDVFDIEVESELHNFVSDGVVVHNSVAEPVRWIWKRLVMLEDSAMIFRLQRAPERFAFYVDVGDLPPQESLAWLNRVRQQFRKKKFVNAQGKLDLKMDFLAPDDDIYIPVRKGTEGTRVEVLGAPAWQSVEDITYFLNKLFAGLKIPKVYMAQDDNAARSVLSQQDVRFARTVLRIQGSVSDGISKICRVHLMALGIDPSDVDYTVHMTIPSSIFELAQLEAMSTRADLAARMGEFVSARWVLSEVFNLNDDEISLLMQEREEDKIRDFVSEARAQAAAQAEFPGYQPGAPASAFAPQPGGDPNAAPGFGPEDPNQQPPGEPTEQPPDQAQGQAFPGTPAAAPGGESKSKKGNIFSSARTGYRSRESREQANTRVRDKRLFEKLDQIRSRDRAFDKRLSELTHLLHDLQLSKRGRPPTSS